MEGRAVAEGATDGASSRGVKRPLEEPASALEPRTVRQEVRAALCLERESEKTTVALCALSTRCLTQSRALRWQGSTVYAAPQLYAAAAQAQVGHPAATPPAGDRAALPPGWAEAVDETYRTRYYYNAGTGERTWELPGGPLAAPAPPPPPPPPPPVRERLPPGWRSALDPATGRPYYCHGREVCWERPVDAAARVGMKRCKGCGGFGASLLKAHGFCMHCSHVLGRMPPGCTSLAAPPAAPAALPAPSVGPTLFAAPPPRGAAPAAMGGAALPPMHAASARIVTMGGRGRGQGGGRARGEEDALDPMDPSSYSDAPRGGWGVGLEQNKLEAAAASAPVRAAPATGAPPVIGAALKPVDGKDGLGEAD